MTIFDYSECSSYLMAYLEGLPKKGHGSLSVWAKKLGVSTTLLSQVVRGNKLLGMEIAHGLAEILGLTATETDYLFMMVEIERAGTIPLKNHFKKKLAEAREASRLLKNRVEKATELSGEAKAQYYSSWIYAGIRNLSACPDITTLESLSERLHLPRASIVEVINFLIMNRLITEGRDRWAPGVTSSYISSDSPLVNKHHQNWRLKAISQMDARSPEDLFYTSPMSLSDSVARKLRKFLVDKIEEIHSKTDPSPSEVVRCLNIDWFEY